MPTTIAIRARCRFFVAALVLVSACGGGSDAPAPTGNINPPPTQPGPPASIAIVSGDAQSAARLAPLAQPLSVLVKDASGTALSGISVQFVVDSGGGTLSSTSATTGANGVAIGGSWTLGNAIGTQVASARVGSLSPVRFHAMAMGPEIQKLFTNRSVPTTGGTITYTKPGDPLDGLAITVPSNAYPTSVLWTVTADSTSQAVLPTDVVQVGPMLTIVNGQGNADSAITFTMPMSVASTDALVPFYYDSTTQTFEGIPLVERTTTSATFATHHFSRDLLAIPGNVSETSALRTSMRLGFGEVKVVWVKTPKENLRGTFSTNFRAARDNWEFVNYGDYVAPGGMCNGMSITSMYYYFFHRSAGEPTLYHHFDKTLADVLDNVQGIRLAGTVQNDYETRVDRGIAQRDLLTNRGIANGAKVEDMTSIWLLMTLKVTARPVLLGIFGVQGGHAVVVYSATSTGTHTEISFADPNLPTTGRSMSFESGVLTPVNLAVRADAPPYVFTKAYAMSVTTDIPLTQISSRYHQFLNNNVGPDKYPAGYRAEYLDYLNNKWTKIAGPIRTSDATLTIRHICEACPEKSPGRGPDEQFSAVWLGDGTGLARPGFNNDVPNKPGTATYYALLQALTPHASNSSFLDALPFDVIYQPFTVTFPKGEYNVGDDITFTAEGGILESAQSKFRWAPDDGSIAVVAGKTYKYRIKQAGTWTMEVKLQDENGKFIARAVASIFTGVHVTVTLSEAKIALGRTVQFIATTNPLLTSPFADKVQYEWLVKGTPTVDCEPTLIATTVCTFPFEGNYTVSVRLFIPQSIGEPLIIGQSAEVPLEVTPLIPVWRLTSFNVSSIVAPGAIFPTAGSSFADFGGVKNSDHVTWYKADSTFIKNLTVQPATGVLVQLLTATTVSGKTYRAGLYLQSDPTGTPGKSATFDPAKTLIPLAQTAAAPFPDVYSPPLLAEPYADVIASTATAISGSSIVQLRDFTGLAATLVAPQRKRTLVAWKVNATKTGAVLSGTMGRTQSMWVYVAQGVYWYNLFDYGISFSATRVP